MVVYKIQRWSPDTCQCVVEQQVGYDEQTGSVVEDPKFLLMNFVCEKHSHMMSPRQMHPNAAQFRAHTTNIIAQTKARNMKQVDDLLAQKNLRITHIRHLLTSKTQVQQHNDEITEEWNELVSLPHAWDSHIYDQIMQEQRARDGPLLPPPQPTTTTTTE